MLDWPCHSRGQIKRSLCRGAAGEFVQGDLVVYPLVKHVAHSLLFFLLKESRLKQELLQN